MIDLLMKFDTESGYLSPSPPPSLSALPNPEISFLLRLSSQKYRQSKNKKINKGYRI